MYKRAGDLLQRFTQLTKNTTEVKEYIQNTLAEAGISSVETKYMTIKGSTLFLKISPLKKSEVFLKQAKILAFLQKNPPTAHITQIR